MGPNIASIDPENNLMVPLYRPRRQQWREQFAAGADGTIRGLTAEGRATVQVMGMNDEEQVRLRAFLFRRGWRP